MKIKKKIIIFGSILISIMILLIICFLMPTVVIKVEGSKKVNFDVNSEYIDKGATAYVYKGLKKKKIDVNVKNNVDYSKIGRYYVEYEAKYKNHIYKQKRVVKIVDKEKPNIILEEQIRACRINNLYEIKVKAEDNYDGDLSDKVIYDVKDDKAYFTVSDSSNNIATLIEDVIYMDEDLPTISLKGSETVTLNVGNDYKEYGVEAYDFCDGDLTSKVTIDSNINVAEAGVYKVVYTISNSRGKEVSIERKVIVKEEKKYPTTKVTDGTIYLTFDDGPYKYTEQLLDILDQYEIKATFFVTNQFSSYIPLIKVEYEKGHQIGIHTCSHKWSNYQSVETYLEDFNCMKNIVFEQTGYTPTIFRFPGGSSNTVSRSYSKGIMTELAKTMNDNGYTYYDWTFDSGDTSKSDNSKSAIIDSVKRRLVGNGHYMILMHDIKKNTIEALPEIIEYAQSRGYKFSKIDNNTPQVHLKIVN